MGLFRVVEPADASIFEGEASLGAIADAARETALYADNYNASERAREEAFDDARAAVRDATGIELDNPQWSKPASVPSPASAFDPLFDAALGREDPFQVWDNRIDEIIQQHPDKAGVLNAARLSAIEEAARTKAREAGQRHAFLQSTRPGLGGLAASLGGGFAGALEDPVTLATLPIGFGAGGARTVAGKVLSTAWREALVSGVTEAAIQPVVQKWRDEAGLPAGFEEGLKNVGMATALGGLLGGVIRGGVEVPGAVGRRLAAKPDPRLPAKSPESIAGDLVSVRDQLPPATRAAVDVFDQDRAVMRAVRGELGEEMNADFGRLMQRADEFAARLDGGDPDEFSRFMREQELRQDPGLSDEFSAAETALERAEKELADLERPLKARTVADTLEGIEPETAARMRAIETELKGQIPAMRRAGIEAERTRIVETVGRDTLERAEREFRIGPEKQVKRAKKKARDARKRFNAVQRKADGRASGRLEAGRAVQRQSRAGAGDAEAPGQTVADPAAPSARNAAPDQFEPGSTEFDAQVASLESQIELEGEIADVLLIDETGKISAHGRTVAEALEEADRGNFLSDLVKECKLS
jgi:hypothetical protein